MDSVDNIPLHIGAKALKSIAYFTLLPQLLKWSQGYFVSIDQFSLRRKNWVELLPKVPVDTDLDAVSSEFFVAKAKTSKAPQFQPNKILDLLLAIDWEIVLKIQDHLEQLEVNDDGVPVR